MAVTLNAIVRLSPSSERRVMLMVGGKEGCSTVPYQEYTARADQRRAQMQQLQKLHLSPSTSAPKGLKSHGVRKGCSSESLHSGTSTELELV